MNKINNVFENPNSKEYLQNYENDMLTDENLIYIKEYNYNLNVEENVDDFSVFNYEYLYNNEFINNHNYLLFNGFEKHF